MYILCRYRDIGHHARENEGNPILDRFVLCSLKITSVCSASRAAGTNVYQLCWDVACFIS
jgi:hypothetical protein